jgi:hypothetical protein
MPMMEIAMQLSLTDIRIFIDSGLASFRVIAIESGGLLTAARAKLTIVIAAIGPPRHPGLRNSQKTQQCRSRHIEATEFLAKRPNQPGECGEIVAAAALSFKSTMLVGFIMILGWPQMGYWHPGQCRKGLR